MASHKLILDVEAEDTILFSLTLRQLVYALFAIGFFTVGVFVAQKSNSAVLGLPFILAGLPFGFLAIPFKRDQSNDIWFLGLLNFWFKNRRRLWLQDSGIKIKFLKPPKSSIKTKAQLKSVSEAELEKKLDSLSRTRNGQSLGSSDFNQPFQGAGRRTEAEYDRSIDALEDKMSQLLSQRFSQTKRKALTEFQAPPTASSTKTNLNPISNTNDIIKGKLSKMGHLKIETITKLLRNKKHHHFLKSRK